MFYQIMVYEFGNFGIVKFKVNKVRIKIVVKYPLMNLYRKCRGVTGLTSTCGKFGNLAPSPSITIGGT